MKKHPPTTWFGMSLLMAGLAICAGGCETQQSAADERRPKLWELSATGNQIEEGPLIETRLRANLLRVEIPLEVSLDDAWRYIDDSSISPVMRNAWQRNGIRIGLLSDHNIESFGAYLPSPQIMRRQLATQRDDPYPLYRSPTIRTAIEADLTIPPLAFHTRTLRHGRLQLLGRFVSEAAEANTLELLLHHHYQTPSVKPRTPQEQELDGHIFEELAVRLNMQPGNVLVIAMNRPMIQVPVPSEKDVPADTDETESRVDPQDDAIPLDPGNDAQPTDDPPSGNNPPPDDAAADNDNAPDGSGENDPPVDLQRPETPPVAPRDPQEASDLSASGDGASQQQIHADENDVMDDQPEDTSPPLEWRLAPLQNNLGAQFFALSTMGRRVQVLLLIRFELDDE